MGRKPDDRFSDGWLAGWLFLAVMWAITQVARIVMDLGAVGSIEALYAWASTPRIAPIDLFLVVAIAVTLWVFLAMQGIMPRR